MPSFDTTLAFFGLALLVGQIGRRLRASLAARRRLKRAAALVFAGLAVRLAIAER